MSERKRADGLDGCLGLSSRTVCDFEISLPITDGWWWFENYQAISGMPRPGGLLSTAQLEQNAVLEARHVKLVGPRKENMVVNRKQPFVLL